jgi:hypothetical protein
MVTHRSDVSLIRTLTDSGWPLRSFAFVGFAFSLTMWLASLDQCCISLFDNGLDRTVVSMMVPMWRQWEACKGDDDRQSLVDDWQAWQAMDAEAKSARPPALPAPPQPSRQAFLWLNIYGLIVHFCHWPSSYRIMRQHPSLVPMQARRLGFASSILVSAGYVGGICAGVGFVDRLRFLFCAMQSIVLGLSVFGIYRRDHARKSL